GNQAGGGTFPRLPARRQGVGDAQRADGEGRLLARAVASCYVFPRSCICNVQIGRFAAAAWSSRHPGGVLMISRLDRRLFVKSVRNMRNALMTHLNRRAGRQFIPAARTALSIETSSVCNLDCCFCAYPKKQSPRVVMSNESFRAWTSQALEL